MKTTLQPNKQRRTRQGFLLLTSYLLLTVASVLSFAFFSRFMGFSQAVERNTNKIRAFQFAEAGVDYTIKTLETNADYTGAGFTTLGSDGGYQLSVTTPETAPLVRLIESTGYAPSNVPTDRAYENRLVQTYVELDITPFDFAAFGDSSVSINGSSGLIDSYNSSNGAYGGANVLDHGNIASDGTITESGSPTIYGDVVSNPNINCSPATTSVPSSGSLSLSGSTVYTLNAGTYRFDSIQMGGNAQIVANGPVTIYVSGSVNIAGNGIATSANTPSNFILIATGSSSVTVGGSAAFYGAVYAPASTVTNNAGDFYGAIMSNNYVHNGSTQLHFDEALQDIPAPCTSVRVLAWEETGTFNENL